MVSSATLGMENGTTRREPRGRRAAATWAALLLAAAPLPGMREVPIGSLAGQIGATAPVRLAPEGLAFDVNEWIAIFLPLQGAEILEVDYRAQGVVLLSWVSGDGVTTPPPHLPALAPRGAEAGGRTAHPGSPHHAEVEPGARSRSSTSRARAAWC